MGHWASLGSVLDGFGGILEAGGKTATHAFAHGFLSFNRNVPFRVCGPALSCMLMTTESTSTTTWPDISFRRNTTLSSITHHTASKVVTRQAHLGSMIGCFSALHCIRPILQDAHAHTHHSSIWSG